MKRKFIKLLATFLVAVSVITTNPTAYAISGFGPNPYKDCNSGISTNHGLVTDISAIANDEKMMRDRVYLPFWSKMASLFKEDGFTDNQIKGMMIFTMGESNYAAYMAYEGGFLNGYAYTKHSMPWWDAWSQSRPNRNGLGLVQWTNGRNRILRGLAKSKDKHWTSPGVQAYLFLKEMRTFRFIYKLKYAKPLPDDPIEMVKVFAIEFENPKAIQSIANFYEVTEENYSKLKIQKTLQVDTYNIDQVIIYMDGAPTDIRNCRGSKNDNPDNSSISAAATSLAYDPEDMTTADATVYDTEFQTSFPSTSLYYEWATKIYGIGDRCLASCDRGTGTVLYYSGVPKEDLPGMGTWLMNSKLASNPRWEKINSSPFLIKDYTPEDLGLQPGDVLLTESNGHTFVYIGKATGESKWPGKGYDVVSASYGMYMLQAQRFKGYSSDSRRYNIWRYKGSLNPSV